MLPKVTETVNAHRLKKMENLVVKVEVAAWRRRNGFDRAEPWLRDGLPLSPEEFTTYLKDEVQELEDAIFLSASEKGLKSRLLGNALFDGHRRSGNAICR